MSKAPNTKKTERKIAKKVNQEIAKESALEKADQKEIADFLYNSIDLFNRLLVMANNAVQMRATKEFEGDMSKIPLDADMIGIVNHVALVYLAMDPIKKYVIADIPEYEDLYKWAYSIYGVFIELQKKYGTVENGKEN